MKHNVVIDGITYVPAEQEPAVSTLTEQEAALLAARVDSDGLHYTLVHYSDFTHGRNEVKDRRFHQLREAYVQSADELEQYLREKGIYG